MAYFKQLEAALGSTVIRRDTVIPETPPLRLGPIYRRVDSSLPGVPLKVNYARHPRSLSDTVISLSYEWGGSIWPVPSVDDTGTGWTRQPTDRLGAFAERYDDIRTQIAATLGEPSRSEPMECSPCLPSNLGLASWRQLDAWENDEITVSLLLEFQVPLVARPRPSMDQRIEVRVFHKPVNGQL